MPPFRLCEGRGEILTKLSEKLRFNLVVAVARERVSTPVAYSKLDESYADFDGSKATGGDGFYNNLMRSIDSGNLFEDSLFNVFEGPIFNICPGAQRLKARMLELGAKAALMSGSGPSVYGVFSNEAEAKNAMEILRKEKITAYAATSL